MCVCVLYRRCNLRREGEEGLTKECPSRTIGGQKDCSRQIRKRERERERKEQREKVEVLIMGSYRKQWRNREREKEKEEDGER